MYNKYPYMSDLYLIPKTCTRTCSIFRISVCGIPIFSKNRHAPGQSRTVTGHAHAWRGFRRASQCSRNNRDATRFDSIRFDSIYEYHGGKTAEIFHSKVAPGSIASRLFREHCIENQIRVGMFRSVKRFMEIGNPS